MPFTPTHTLAVLPVARWLPLSALVIGSMIPDLPLYYDIGLRYDTTHSFAGLVTVCLPLGLVVYLLYHALVKRPIVALLPDDTRARLHATLERRVPVNAASVVGVVFAVWLGSLTHTVWDAFTHAGRWGVKAVPLLDDTVRIASVDVPGYAIFQHGASLIGLPLLAWLALRWVRAQPQAPFADGMRPVLRVAISGLLLTLPTLVGVQAVARQGIGPIELELFRFVTVGGGVFMLLVLAYGVIHTATGFFSPSGRA